MRKMCLCSAIIILLFYVSAWGQPGSLTLDMLMDVPSAKALSSGDIETELRMYPNGGLLATILVGVSHYFSLGVSYGGENIIGTGDANMNPQPCVHVKFLLFEERFLFPAIMLGFNSQGYGAYLSSLKRYTIKSRGLYAVASKNTSFLGGLGIHAGVNWSLEREDGDSDLNIFAGCHKFIRNDIVILSEYDTAINDNSDNAIGSGKGYLNVGVRWSFAQRLFVEFALKNILENGRATGSVREVKLVYLTFF